MSVSKEKTAVESRPAEERFAARRSNIQVIADILAEAMKGASKTRLVYRANLNFKVLERYLRFLNDREMIQLIKEGDTGRDKYVITQRGREFLLHYSQVEELLNLVEDNGYS